MSDVFNVNLDSFVTEPTPAALRKVSSSIEILSIVLCLGISVTPGAALAAQAGYDVTVLQDVGGRGNSGAVAINAFGWSVGLSFLASGEDAVLWSPSGKATVLQNVGDQGRSRATAINAFGWSVGSSDTGIEGYRAPAPSDAVLWSPSGKATVLQDVGGRRYNSAGAINAFGWSVGYSASGSDCGSQPCPSDAVLWSPSGQAKVLQDVGGQGQSAATAINDLGWSVGRSFTASGEDAVLWSPSGKAKVLQDAGGGIGFSWANAINAFGWSIGYSETASGDVAVLWSPSGKATVLQDAGGGTGFSSANAINAFGWTVGETFTASGSDAVLWSPSGQATVLQIGGGNSIAYAINDLGWTVGQSGSDAVLWSPSGQATDLGAVLGSAWSDTYADGLNDAGDILGQGYYEGGFYSFLLTPNKSGSLSLASVSITSVSDPAAPELSTWVMMVVGFVGLVLAGSRNYGK